MKNIIKILGIEDGREAYKVTIRKDHQFEDYAEVIKLQESSLGKRRFYMCFDGFSKKECEDFMKRAIFINNLRNSLMRNNYKVRFSSMALQ